MATPGLVYLSIIIVILVIVGAYFAFKAWRRRHEGFSLATPATPLVREAVGGLFAELKTQIRLGREFDAIAARRADLAGTRAGAARVTDALAAAERQLVGSPPTYVNYLAVYRGLAGSDRAVLAAADAYTQAGRAVQQRIAAAEPANDTLVSSSADVDAARALTGMGAQLRRIVVAVHRLGSALDVE